MGTPNGTDERSGAGCPTGSGYHHQTVGFVYLCCLWYNWSVEAVCDSLMRLLSMNKQPNERVLTKDDGDLFQLVKRLTEEQPPGQALGLESVIVGERLVLSTPPGVAVPASTCAGAGIREIEINLPDVRVIVSLNPVAA